MGGDSGTAAFIHNHDDDTGGRASVTWDLSDPNWPPSPGIPDGEEDISAFLQSLYGIHYQYARDEYELIQAGFESPSSAVGTYSLQPTMETFTYNVSGGANSSELRSNGAYSLTNEHTVAMMTSNALAKLASLPLVGRLRSTTPIPLRMSQRPTTVKAGLSPLLMRVAHAHATIQILGA